MTPRILVAEDDEDTLEALEWLLRKEGFRVTSVGNGLDALREMHGAAPDMLLLDLDMPWVTGWDVLERMSRDPALRAIPTMVISGHIFDARTPRDVIALVKPVDPARLLATIQALVGEPSRHPATGDRSSTMGDDH
jgi:CheY-like chemotaxis protein